MRTRAVFLDALGTLVELEPPWVHLAAAAGLRADERSRRAFRAEMAYYREHAVEADDERSLAELRASCAQLLSRELGREVSVETMMSAIRFRPFADATLALAELRGRDLAIVCVSNWDVSLPEVLSRCGLGELIDDVVTSAEVGAAKPDPAIFEAALARAGCTAEEALHVGDSPEEDVAGARAAGIPALLIDRSAGAGIASLGEIVDHLRR